MCETSGRQSIKREGQGKPKFSGPPCVLVAEDDKEMRMLLVRSLRKAGYRTTECPNGTELLAHLGSYCLPDSHERIDLVISDIRMPGVSGLAVLAGLRDRDGFPPMILITAFGDQATHMEAHLFGAVAMFDKPFDFDELIAKVRQIVPPSI